MAEQKIYLTKKEQPYASEQVANLQQGKLKAKGVETKIIPYDTEEVKGFALQEVEAQQATGSEPQEPRQESAARPDRLAEKRKKRAGLTTRKNLEVEKQYIPPGFKGYWELDSPNIGGRRIHRRIKAGWDYVTIKDGHPTPVAGDVNKASPMGSVVTMPAGNGGTLYLMIIEKELFDEDRAAHEARLDKIDEQMQRQAHKPDIEGTGIQSHVTKPVARSF